MSKKSTKMNSTEAATFILVRASLVLFSVNSLLGFACVCKTVLG